eukprot:jgi/Hompol1/5121/HPOL_000432-RA
MSQSIVLQGKASQAAEAHRTTQLLFAAGCIGIAHSEPAQKIGGRFWDLVLQEQAKYNKSGTYDDSLSSFFRHVDEKRGQRSISVGKGTEKIRGLKARVCNCYDLYCWYQTDIVEGSTIG